MLRTGPRLRAWLVWAGLAIATPASALTLEDVLGAPFPSDLTVARGKSLVAWVSNERGVRNIVIAEQGPDGRYVTRRLTGFSHDDGVELDHLAFADHDRALVYTSGGSLEGGGPVNPMSSAAGPVAKTVLVRRLADAAPRELGAGEDPVPAPIGDRVAFVRAGQIWIAGLAGVAASDRPELALLRLLDEEPRYGLDILERLRADAGLMLAEGAIYPLLHRLEKSGWTTAEWRIEDGNARPRKYYAITAAGRAELAAQRADWIELSTRLAAFLERSQP